jgi:hypothetical protein
MTLDDTTLLDRHPDAAARVAKTADRSRFGHSTVGHGATQTTAPPRLAQYRSVTSTPYVRGGPNCETSSPKNGMMFTR